jgi:tRNA-dihydrouridine synthase B
MVRPAPYDSPVAHPLVLAPMAELGHAAFRMLVREFGGCDLLFTEMLSAATLCARGDQRSLFLIQDPSECDLVHQIAGGDPWQMSEAAARLADRGVARLDINMGCSAPLIIDRGWGVALMREPERARAVLAAVRRRFTGHLSVKIRQGWVENTERFADFCRMLEEEGAQTLAVHPRLKHEKFKGLSRWPVIAHARQILSIPVVGNGDIHDGQDVARMRAETGCDGVMIGREAARRPWIFREVATGKPWCPDARETLRRFVDLLSIYLPPEKHLSRLKIFLAWFSQPLPFGHTLKTRVQSAATMPEAADRIEAFFLQVSQAGPAPTRDAGQEGLYNPPEIPL